MTKLSLTVKTDYVTSSTGDVDPHPGRYGRLRSEWVGQLEEWSNFMRENNFLSISA